MRIRLPTILEGKTQLVHFLSCKVQLSRRYRESQINWWYVKSDCSGILIRAAHRIITPFNTRPSRKLYILKTERAKFIVVFGLIKIIGTCYAELEFHHKRILRCRALIVDITGICLTLTVCWAHSLHIYKWTGIPSEILHRAQLQFLISWIVPCVFIDYYDFTYYLWTPESSCKVNKFVERLNSWTSYWVWRRNCALCVVVVEIWLGNLVVPKLYKSIGY